LNNKPAAGWTLADNEWGWGAVQRVQLLRAAVARHSTHTLGSLVAAMNRAATQDLQDAVVLPAIAGLLRTGPGRALASRRCSPSSNNGGPKVRLAVDKMQAERASHFDPEVLDALMVALPEVEAIRRACGD
jgi:hypothetical protein